MSWAEEIVTSNPPLSRQDKSVALGHGPPGPICEIFELSRELLPPGIKPPNQPSFRSCQGTNNPPCGHCARFAFAAHSTPLSSRNGRQMAEAPSRQAVRYLSREEKGAEK